VALRWLGKAVVVVVWSVSGRVVLVIDFAFASPTASMARKPRVEDSSVWTGIGPVDGPPGNDAPTAMAGAVAVGSVPGSAGRPGVDS
jgi:hypothetical protein